jgi:LVIVD repeat
MIFRALFATIAALALLATSAFAQDAEPLAGKGENIAPVARVKIPRPTDLEMAGDWAFVATDAAEESGGGVYIVNISDPAHPYIQGKWTADESQLDDFSAGDIDLTTDGNLAVLTNAHCSSCSEGNVSWAALIDVTDKSHPKLASAIKDDDTMDYVHTATVDNKTLYLNPQVFAGYPQPGNEHITVFDISDRTHPVKKGTITTPLPQLGLAHDTYIDHRPDGKTLMYAASVHRTDVLDVTDPLNANWLQTSTSEYTISHDVQPNHDRTIIVVDDEGAAGGQLAEEVSLCGKVGSGGASLDSGSVHFFAAAPDGTLANGGLVHLGSYNAPTNFNTGACVAHVFWQAPTENRLTQAYYRTGAFTIDFEDPANPKLLGWFLPDGGANYWSNKPHRGYMFASDQEGHLDILKYTGEGGTRWPATAGPAEIQRSARQGVPYVPIAGVGAIRGTATAGKAGTFSFTLKVKRVPGAAGKKVKLALKFTNAKGKAVESLSVKRAAGKKASVKVSGSARPGTYRWTLTAGKKRLAKGKFKVKAKRGHAISAGATMIAKAK